MEFREGVIGMARPVSNAEKKSERTNFALYPSVKEAIGKVAHIQQTTINDVVNQALQEYIEKYADKIEKYDAFLTSLNNE